MRGQANAARHKNTGCIYITSFLAVTAFILLTPFLSKASEITLADVAEAQEQATDGIETRSEIVETNTEAGGKSTTFVYEYTAITDPDTGKRKTLVTSHGRFQMQFMVDEEEMSVTYLMGGGKKMKVTLTAEQQAQIEEMMSLNMIHGSGGSMFASNTGGLRDIGGGRARLDRQEVETENMRIRVDRKRSSRNRAVVEYENRKMLRTREKLDTLLLSAEKSEDGREGRRGREMIEMVEKNRDKLINHMIYRRVEKINMRTGLVEEQEMYNQKGEKIGWFKVKKSKEVDFRAQGKRRGADRGENIKIRVPVESEGRIKGPLGESRFRIKTRDTRINEDVKFEWLK